MINNLFIPYKEELEDTKGQTTIYKTLHIKLKIDYYEEPH